MRFLLLMLCVGLCLLTHDAMGQLRPLRNYKLTPPTQRMAPKATEASSLKQATVEGRNLLIKRRNKNAGPRRKAKTAAALSDRAYYEQQQQRRKGQAAPQH